MDNFMHSMGSIFEGRRGRRQHGHGQEQDQGQQEQEQRTSQRRRNRNQQQEQQSSLFGEGGNPFQHVTEQFQNAFSSATAAAASAASAAAGQSQQQQNAQPPRKAPPASREVLKKLPTIVVSPQDLVDPCNRECCICFEDHPLHSKVLRLPCAHIYHPHCIMEWLSNKSNSCPICRYELPTEDPHYEAIREQHMKYRKPRFAMYELERMSIRMLQKTCRKLHIQIPSTVVEKQELIQLIQESQKVDIITTPKPVEYQKSLLQHMSIKELKHCMNDMAGVFFDPIDVIEKNDMIDIFINSGRLIVLPEDDDDDDDDEEEEEDGEYTNQEENIMEYYDNEQQEDDRKMPAKSTSISGKVQVETVVDDSDEEEEEKTTPKTFATTNTTKRPKKDEPFMVYNQEYQDYNQTTNETTNFQEKGHDTNEEKKESTQEDDTTNCMTVDGEGDSNTNDTDAAHETTSRDHVIGGTAINSTDSIRTQDESTYEPTPPAAAEAVTAHNDNDHDPSNDNREDQAHAHSQIRTQYQNRSISQLKADARQMNIDLSNCIERSEMVDQLVKAASAASRTTSAAVDDTTTTRTSVADNHDATHSLIVQELSNWNTSQLVTIAQHCHIPTTMVATTAAGAAQSHPETQEHHQQLYTDSELVYHIVEASQVDPRVKQYLLRLIPLSKMTISELRQYGVQHHINLSHCIERSEMIQMLLNHSSIV